MKRLFMKLLNSILTCSFFINGITIPASANDTSSKPQSRIPYTVACDDVMKVLEAGQLEELILSTERSEAELIQILTDNHVLFSSVFFKTFALEILPSITMDKKVESLENEDLKSLIKKIVKFLKQKEPFTNEQVDQLLNKMATVASGDANANRTLHLIIKRTTEALQNNTANKVKIYDIYKKALYYALLGFGFALIEPAEEQYHNSNKDLSTSAIFGSTAVFSSINLIASLFIAWTVSKIFGVNSSITFQISSGLFESAIVMIMGAIAYDYYFGSPSKIIRNLKKLSKNQTFRMKNFAFDSLESFRQILSKPENLKELSLLELSSQVDLSRISLTQAAYVGHSDIFLLNEQYTTLNKLELSLSDNFASVRAAAQAVISNPTSYDNKMELSIVARDTITEVEANLAAQKRELKSVLTSLETLQKSLTHLQNTPYSSSRSINREDIIKGKIILERFEKELKNLANQSINAGLIQNKITQSERISQHLKTLSDNIPTTALGWEEAAKNILQEIDAILMK